MPDFNSIGYRTAPTPVPDEPFFSKESAVKISIQDHLRCLGLSARDRVTGFKGVISTVSFDLYGCIQAVVTPPVDDKGQIPDGKWFDLNRLELGMDRVMEAPAFVELPDRAVLDKGPAEKPARQQGKTGN